MVTEEQTKDIIDGLASIGALDNNRMDGSSYYTCVLSGYAKNTGALRVVHETVRRLKKVNADLIYLCDPVLGDNGKLYVAKEAVEFYRDHLVPCADVITPNQFEAE